MKNTGYVIAKNKGLTEFFTASSAYDRPRWVSLAEATNYPTADMAQTASTKLYKSSGSYEARLVSVQELKEARGRDMSYAEQPYDDSDEAGIMPDGEVGASDDNKMVAKQQGSDPTIDPEADDELGLADEGRPDDAEDQADIEDLVNTELGDDNAPVDELPNDEGSLDDEFVDPATSDAELDSGDIDSLSTDPESELDDTNDLEHPTGVTESVKAMSVVDVGPEADVSNPHEEKVKVPASIKSELKKAIAEFEKAAKFANTRDDAKATFCMTVVEAFRTLLDYLDVGTVESMKLAQVHMMSWMNPITNHLPVSVQQFVIMGGRKPSLKDLFDSKRESKKAV